MLAPKRGFTIIELIVSVVIISILATVAMVEYQDVRDKSKDTRGIADLEALAGGLTMFKADNKRYPVGNTSDGAFRPGDAFKPGGDFTSYNNGGEGYCAHTTWAATPTNLHYEWNNLGVALSSYLPNMPKPWEYGKDMRYCNGKWFGYNGEGTIRTTSNFEIMLFGLSATQGDGTESWDPGQRFTTNQIVHY